MTTKKKVFLAILLLGIIAAAIAFYMYNKPTKNYATSSADYTLTAKALFDEFALDQNKATAKYVSDNKTVQISGTILEVKKNDDGTTTLTIDVSVPDSDISCTLTAEESKTAANFATGANVTLKGQCTGFQELIGKEVIMMRCGIVK
jgi:type II secretory pathway pseudopilin PulG